MESRGERRDTLGRNQHRVSWRGIGQTAVEIAVGRSLLSQTTGSALINLAEGVVLPGLALCWE